MCLGIYVPTEFGSRGQEGSTPLPGFVFDKMGPGAGGDFAGDSHLRTRNQVTFLAVSIAGYGPQLIENKPRQRCRITAISES